jgi:hypothetical protein
VAQDGKLTSFLSQGRIEKSDTISMRLITLVVHAGVVNNSGGIGPRR